MSLNRFLLLSWWFEPRIIRSKYETDPVHIKTSSVHVLSAKESPIPSQTRYHSVLSSHIRTHAIKSPEALSHTQNPAQKSILCRLCHHKFCFFRWQSSCYSPHPFTHTQPLTYTRFCKIFDSFLEKGWAVTWRENHDRPGRSRCRAERLYKAQTQFVLGDFFFFSDFHKKISVEFWGKGLLVFWKKVWRESKQEVFLWWKFLFLSWFLGYWGEEIERVYLKFWGFKKI